MCFAISNAMFCCIKWIWILRIRHRYQTNNVRLQHKTYFKILVTSPMIVKVFPKWRHKNSLQNFNNEDSRLISQNHLSNSALPTVKQWRHLWMTPKDILFICNIKQAFKFLWRHPYIKLLIWHVTIIPSNPDFITKFSIMSSLVSFFTPKSCDVI